MTIKSLREWLQEQPEEYDNFQIQLSEYSRLTTENYCRMDNPAGLSFVDIKNKEFCIIPNDNVQITEEFLRNNGAINF